jgi:hypothetical protein
VFLDKEEPFVKTINNFIKVEHGDLRMINCSLNEVNIKQAYIITSQKSISNSKKKSSSSKAMAGASSRKRATSPSRKKAPRAKANA